MLQGFSYEERVLAIDIITYISAVRTMYLLQNHIYAHRNYPGIEIISFKLLETFLLTCIFCPRNTGGHGKSGQAYRGDRVKTLTFHKIMHGAHI